MYIGNIAFCRKTFLVGIFSWEVLLFGQFLLLLASQHFSFCYFIGSFKFGSRLKSTSKMHLKSDLSLCLWQV